MLHANLYPDYVWNLLALIVAFAVFRILFSSWKPLKKRLQNGSSVNERRLCAIVTGCSSGIGFATVRSLLEKTSLEIIGVDVAKVQDPDLESNVRFSSFKCDVTVDTDLRSVLDYVKKKNFIVDVLCCCAGITRTGPLMEVLPDHVQKVMDVNVMGVHRCVHSFFGRMRKGSVVVVILSEIAYAMQSSAFNAAYSMSKFALQAYVTALRQELELVGVHVKGVYPGAIETPLSMKDTVEMSKLHISKKKTIYRNALMQFAKKSSAYINRYAKNPQCVVDEIVNICLYQDTPNSVLVNTSNLMRILKYMPQFLMDLGTSKMLKTVQFSGSTPSYDMLQKERRIINEACLNGNLFDDIYELVEVCAKDI